MARHNKLIDRFLNQPKDFEWREIIRLLNGFGYNEVKGGKTSGSRVRFRHTSLMPINLHKPHPGSIIKPAMMKELLAIFKDRGLI